MVGSFDAHAKIRLQHLDQGIQAIGAQHSADPLVTQLRIDKHGASSIVAFEPLEHVA